MAAEKILKNVLVKLGADPGKAKVKGVSIDTRTIAPGDVFVAIQGDHHDGHQYLDQAIDAGASMLVLQYVPDGWSPKKVIRAAMVADTRYFLGEIALEYRQALGCKVCAITGSVGKTTTKSLLGSILESTFETVTAPASFNNDIGVPLTILRADESTEVIVLEMGINHPGEMDRLVEIGQPDVGILTGVCPVHLEGMGDETTVLTEKWKLIESVPGEGTVIIPGDDPRICAFAVGLKSRAVTVGEHHSVKRQLVDIASSPVNTRFHMWDRVWQVPLGGPWNAMNAALAIAAADALGVEPDTIDDSLRNFEGLPLRMEHRRISGCKVILDAYNSNPTALSAGINAVARWTEGRWGVLIGEMKELGDASEEWHRKLGEELAELNPAWVVAYGDAARCLIDVAHENGVECAIFAADADAAVGALARYAQTGDLVYVKGSRGNRLEDIVASWEGIHAINAA